MTSYLPAGFSEKALEHLVETVSRDLPWISPAAAFLMGLTAAQLPRLGRWLKIDRAAVLAGCAAIGGLGLAAAVGATFATFAPQGDGDVAAVFPPWIAAEEVAERVYRAGGVAIGDKQAGWIQFAVGRGERFEAALSREGAWILLDGRQTAYWFGHPS